MQKLIIIATFVVLLISISVTAQPRQSTQDRVKALKERLNLNDDQTAQVEKIYTQAQEKMKNAKDRSEFREIMTDANDQVLKLLTDTQKAEYNKMRDERMSRMHNRQGNNTPRKADSTGQKQN